MKQKWGLGCVRNARRRCCPITARMCLGLTSQKTSATTIQALYFAALPLMVMHWVRKAVLWRAVNTRVNDVALRAVLPQTILTKHQY
jgi:hypothetical protein